MGEVIARCTVSLKTADVLVKRMEFEANATIFKETVAEKHLCGGNVLDWVHGHRRASAIGEAVHFV